MGINKNLKEDLMSSLSIYCRTIDDIQFIRERGEYDTIPLEDYLRKLEVIKYESSIANGWNNYNVIGVDFVIIPRYDGDECGECNWLEFIDLR